MRNETSARHESVIQTYTKKLSPPQPIPPWCGCGERYPVARLRTLLVPGGDTGIAVPSDPPGLHSQTHNSVNPATSNAERVKQQFQGVSSMQECQGGLPHPTSEGEAVGKDPAPIPKMRNVPEQISLPLSKGLCSILPTTGRSSIRKALCPNAP